MRWEQFKSQLKGWFASIIRDENLYLRFFALFLAIILWFLAGGVIRFASVERTFTIPLQVRNIPKDFALVNEPESVRISVRSLPPLIATAERDAQAFIDLSEAIEGNGTYGVDISVPPGVEIVNVSPRWIRLSTEKILEKDFPVFVAALGLKPNQLIQSQLSHTEVVRVRAPRSKLNQISQVVVYVGLVHGANRIEGTFPIKAINENGRILEGISFFPEDIRVILETVTLEIPLASEELLQQEQIEEKSDLSLKEELEQELPTEPDEKPIEEEPTELEDAEEQPLQDEQEEQEAILEEEDRFEEDIDNG